MTMSNAHNELKDTRGGRAGAAEPVAIVGMAVDVPGAGAVETFWQNLRDGVSSITPVDEAALLATGEPLSRIRHKDYVAATARMEGFDKFDAEFFGFSAKEAAILDPQHRKFLEAAWTSLENAGHTPGDCGGNIGVFAGCGMGSYFYFNLCSNPDLVDDVGMFLLRHTGNDKDFLATRVSHILDLKGPSINVQTACSTSLVAVHYACNALRQGDCGMALAGGVTIELPQGRGYLFKENEILSPDGQCHAFDHRAQGTVFGSGAGCVVLRRLSDALADGDHIWAVIRGSAVNNDGADKASYLAPSVDGQAAAVARAIDAAGVSADSIDYVECHGTGTYLGDPIEVSALTEAFRRTDTAVGHCRIGSVKTNIGHLDTAAGVASLVKATLALKHRQMPPSLGYEAPNPAIDFETSPFRVSDRLRDWPDAGRPRRAGVNSLGVGGTNAHAVLEEAPGAAPSEESDWPFHVLCLSGRGKAALAANTAALVAHLRAHPEQPLADIAHTLRNGRQGFAKRRVVVAETHEDAAALLEAGDTRRVFTHDVLGDDPEVVFMFPGGGAQYPQMARDLYETEPVFAEWMDRGIAHLQAQVDYDVRALWLPEPGDEAAAERLKTPSVQLPLIMIVEYALAQLWMSWGVKPAALVGHSMGENVAACLAGVMRFEDCIDLVLLRGRLFDSVPAGGMLSVSLPVSRLEALVGDDLDIASVNAPELSAVSGPQDKLDAFAAVLDGLDVDYQRVAIDIAAHSRMLDPILDEFRAFLARLDLNAPQLPVMSNRTGDILTAAQAMDPEYWTRQLRHRVAFGACIDALAETPGRVYLEVGPGKALSALAQMSPGVTPGQVISSLRHPDQDIADDAYFLGVIGRLWACGVEADWSQIWGEARRNRVPLPTYAFQRKRYFIEPGKAVAEGADTTLLRKPDMAEWGYRAAWVPRYPATVLDAGQTIADLPETAWLVFVDETGLGDSVADRLEHAGHRVVRVVSGDTTERQGPGRYSLAPELGRASYDHLFEMLAEAGALPDRIAHFWLVTGREGHRPGSSFFDRNMEHGFYSLMHVAQAMGNADMPGPVHVTVVTNGAEQVTDEALPHPEKSVIAGPAGVIPRELPGVTCATLDVELPAPGHGGTAGFFGKREAPRLDLSPLVARVIEDLAAEPGNGAAALRGGTRYEKTHRPVPLPEVGEEAAFRRGGTYLVTGGFGGIGLTVARDLITRLDARVALLSRHELPPRDAWDDHLASAPAMDGTARRIRQVRELEEAGGGRVMTVAADICNREEMARAKADVEAAFGPVSGVIHAAGAIDDGPLLAKSEADAARVLAPKMTGLRVLDELFPDGTLDLMVLFASTSTVTTPAGQVDYAAANTYFNAFARSRSGARTRVVAVNWGVWAEVGMAADAMAARTGAETAALPVRQPIWETLREKGGRQVLDAAIGTARHWVVDGHRTAAGDALLPGTGFVELAAEAMAARGLSAPYAIRGLTFLRPLDVADGEARRIEAHCMPEGSAVALEIRSACRVGGRDGTVCHAQATVEPMATGAPDRLDTAAIAGRCPTRETARGDQTLASPQEAHLDFGARWRVLRDRALGDREGLAWLALPAACRGDIADGYLAHPGLLDIATGWAMDLIPGYRDDTLWVPLAYAEIRVWRPLPAEVQSWVRLAADSAGGDEACFDVTLCDADGEVCLDITGFRMRRLEQRDGFGKPAPVAPAEVMFDDAAGGPDVPLSPEEERLRHNIAEGIRPEEGAEALRRALATGRSEVIVSSLDLDGLVAQAGVGVQAGDAETRSFERPDLEGEYLAPRTATEEALAGIWEKLLGVSPIGVADSFFDLGGHSLIAVRLFATIKREFDVEFPISVLFEAPTIADCATLIEARSGGRAADVAPDDPEATAPPAAPTGFTHLVALNKVENATKPPLFIVAGMFGNVLNLRHLSQQLGADQPVYGLQARGLVGDAEPHTDIVAAAADYIAEIRQVQPQGPYLLGGFSGGGITAYEIAQQLDTAGDAVAMLALLDTPLPVRSALTRRDKALIKMQEFRRKGPAYLREWAVNRMNWEVAKRRGAGAGDAGGGFNNRRIELAFRQAVAAYDVKPWNGPALLFRPPLDRYWRASGGRWISREREYVFADNQWTGWAPGLRVIEVPGDHDSMVLNPNVTVLAAHMAEEIAAALDGSRPRAWSSATAAE